MTRIVRTLAACALTMALCAASPASAQEAQATNLSYTGATSAQNASDLAAAATLSYSSTDPDTGDPVEVTIDAGEVTFTVRDEQGTEVASVTATTDASGVATAALRLNAPVGDGYLLEVAFAGDEAFAPSSTSVPITVETAQTKLTYNGAVAGVRGITISLGVKLEHVVNNDDLAGREIHFSIPDLLDTAATTNSAGQASVSFPLTATYGSYPLTVTYAGEDGFAGTAKTQSIAINWSWTFTSLQGLGTIRLNDVLNEFRVVTPSVDSGVVPGADVQNHTPQFAQFNLVSGRYASATAALELTGVLLSSQLGGNSFQASGFIGTTPFAMSRVPSV
ncbi:MAG TPA: hypothetical protein VGB51_07050 [Actinomycetota bacterium]